MVVAVAVPPAVSHPPSRRLSGDTLAAAVRVGSTRLIDNLLLAE
jgi:pantothenate synthetase